MSQLKKGALLSYTNILLTNVIGLLLTPFIIKALGNSEYGLYTLIGAFIGYISVMDLGLNNTIVRYVSKFRAEKDQKKEQEFLGQSMFVYMLISLIVCLFGFFFYFRIDSLLGSSLTEEELVKAKLMSLILIFNLAISLPGGAFTAICNAYEHFVFPRTLSIVRYVLRSILVVVILKYGADSIGLVILDTIVNIIAILLSIIYVKRKLKTKFIFSTINYPLLGEIFSYSIWIFIFAIIGQFQWKGGQVIIGAQLDTTQVAIYAIGIMLGSYYGAFSGAISGVFLPRATQMVVKSATPNELTSMLIKIARFNLISLMLIFVGFYCFGKEFITLWVGEEFIASWIIAVVVMLGYTVPLLQSFANSLLEAKKMFKVKAIVYVVTLGLGTLVGFLTVKNYGISSVIIALVTGWSLGVVVMNLYFHKKLELDMIRFFKELCRGLLIVFILINIIGLLLNYVPVSGWMGLLLKIIIFVSSYGLLIYFIGGNKEEKQVFTNLLLKLKK